MSPTFATDLLTRYLTIPAWLPPLWAQPNTRTALLLIVGACVFAVATRGMGSRKPDSRQQRVQVQADKPLPRVRRQNIMTRRLPVRKVERPLVLYGHTYDVYERLIGIVSIPGTGKSSLLAEMMAQSGGRCVCISGGKSPPLIDTVYAMGGRHWETTGTLGIDLLDGDYRRVPQVLEHMFPPSAGDGGLFRSLFRQITRDHFLELAERGDERSFPGIIGALRAAKPDRYPGISPTMIGNWTARMTEVLDSLGPALGTDLNVAEACRVGVPVLFTLDKRRDPSGTLRRMFAAAGMSSAMQAVAEGHAPMVLVDELGLLDADSVAEDARTVREAGVLFAAAAHGKQDFGNDLRSLTDFWIFGTLAADEPETRQWASATTFGTKSAESFGGHALPKGHFIVWDGTQVHDDLVIPRYSRRAWSWDSPDLPTRAVLPPASAHSASNSSASSSKHEVRAPDAGAKRPLVYGPVGMPACYSGAHVPDALRPQLEVIWLRHNFPAGVEGCYESTYHRNNRGRPRCSLDGADWTTYILARTLEDARLRGMTPEQTLGFMAEIKLKTGSGELTVDHVEGCENEVCDRPDHLAWEGRGRNSQLYHERKREVAVA